MATVAITNVGSPADDPTCILPGTLYLPTTAQPWPCIVGTVAGGFQSSFNLTPIRSAFLDLSAQGFLCLAMFVRLTDPIPTQTTTGKWHQQTDDLKIGIRAMRSNPFSLGYSVSGKVGTLGGSGSAHHALYCAIDGTNGDDKADFGICMSAPTDLSDRQADVTQSVINHFTDYGNSTDLPTLLTRSPVSLTLANAKPIRAYNGTSESIPYSQLTILNTAMSGAGVSSYIGTTNSGVLASLHSFDMWSYISAEVVNWLQNTVLLSTPILPGRIMSGGGYFSMKRG